MQNDQNSRSMVPAKPAGPLFAPLVELPAIYGMTNEVPGVFSSLKLETAEQRLNFADLLNFGADDSSQRINTELAVRDITVMHGEFVNAESGEIEFVPRIMLHLDDGSTVRFASKGVWISIRSYLLAGVIPPFDPPLKFVLRQMQLGEKMKPLHLERVITLQLKLNKSK